MSRFPPRFVFAFSISLFAFVLIGCGSSGGEEASSGEWTIKEGALALEEDLRVSDNEDFYFGGISDVAVGEEGRIYVADDEAHHIKVLSPEGRLVKTIGTQGEGPGEFKGPEQLVLAREDSLYVLDDYRVLVFTPSHEFAYSFNPRTEERRPSRLMVPETHPGYILTYPPPLRSGDKEEGRLLVQRVGPRGAVGETLFATRPSKEIYTKETDGVVRTFYGVPFLCSPHFAVGPAGNVQYAWNDSVRVTSYDVRGRRLGVMDVPFEAVPVTEADRERVMEEWSDEKKAMLRSIIPGTKPAFEHFLVDGEGRFWFGRPTNHPDSTSWWVAAPDEKRVVTAKLPSKVEFLEVKGGFAYGKATTEQGAPALVRYRVEQNQ